MTDREQDEIVEAARRHAVESAREQGLPETVDEPDVLRQVAALVNPAPEGAEDAA